MDACIRVAVDSLERNEWIVEIQCRAKKVERQTSLMWRCMVKELSSWTPRYFTDGRKDIELFDTSTEVQLVWLRVCFEPDFIASVFSGLSLSLLLFIQIRILFIQFSIDNLTEGNESAFAESDSSVSSAYL